MEDIKKLENRIKKLEKTLKNHTHKGYDNSSKIKGNLILDGKSVLGVGNAFRGFARLNNGQYNEFMRMGNSVGVDTNLETSSSDKGQRTRNTQLTLENITEPYRRFRGAWTTSTDYSVLDAVNNDGDNYICGVAHTSAAATEPGTGGSWASYWVKMNYWSFYYGWREPIIINNEQSVTSGEATLQDTNQTWGVNELQNSYITVTGNTIGLETYQIASNTADTITIDGTWGATDSNVIYVVFRPVYLGAADYPWKRLYLMDDIRFGKGASSGSDVIFIKYGEGTPEGSITANVGSLYLRTDGGASTTLYVKESGTGNTGWQSK